MAEPMDDVHKALTDHGWKCGDDNKGGVMCWDVAEHLRAAGWKTPADLAAAQARGAEIEARARAVVELRDSGGWSSGAEDSLIAALAEALEGGTDA